MSKEYNIHWRRSDYSKLSHLVRKVNKKIFEIQVKQPDIADYQPEMIDYQDLKSQIKTRHDFNMLMNKYNRYLREGAENVVTSDRGAKSSKWAVNEFRIYQNAENTRRRKALKDLGELDVTIGGKSTGNKRSEMGTIHQNANKQSNKKFKNMSQKEWEKAFRNFEKKMLSSQRDSERLNQMRNYVRGLISEGYSEELQEMFNHISLDDFERVMFSDETATFDFIYDPIELDIKQERLIDLWREYVDDNINHNIDLNESS